MFPGARAEQLVRVADFEQLAKTLLPKDVLGYYASGACDEVTLRQNISAFSRLRIRPKVLVNASKRTMTRKILGSDVSMPIGVSPSAMQKMAHPDGEIANASAVGKLGSIYILSTLSTTSMEDLARHTPNTIKWFQLYVYKDRELSKSLIKRAEAAGFKALVLTVDTCVFGIRYRDARNKFSLPPHLSLANFSGMQSQIEKAGSGGSGLLDYVNTLFDDSLTWEDVKWLKSVTKLPIVLKGIMTGEDAELAVKYGADAVMVSNHGGRQLDTSPATIEALPEVVKAVAGRCEVYLDGGIRYGTDVFKALALGAKMVFVARPVIWGLTCGGEEGVTAVLNIIREEFSRTMALAGCQKLEDIKPHQVVHQSYYAKF